MMTKDKSNQPLCRFSEFRNTGAWSEEMMQVIFDIKNGYTPSKSNPLYWEDGTIPWFRMEDIRKNGHILSESIQHITTLGVKKGGLFPAYSIIVATTATIGEHALIIVDSLANQRFTFLTKRKSFCDRIDMLYFHYFMFIVDEWCKRNTNSGGLLSVNMDSFKKLMIPYPQSLTEQHKIAGCFSTLDRMIDATKRKLELLREHRKGLMQRMFPTEGKTMPEFRFPEFRNTGEWTYKRLKEIAQTFSGGTPSVGIREYYGGTIPFIRSGEIANDKTELYITDLGLAKSSAKMVESGTILYALYGATSGTVAISKIEGAINQAILAIIPDEDMYDKEYLYQFLKYQKPYILNCYLQGGQGNLSGAIINDLQIVLPCNADGAISLAEQRRIAECFASLDRQIEAVKRKLELLKELREGLMQQLFPKI